MRCRVRHLERELTTIDLFIYSNILMLETKFRSHLKPMLGLSLLWCQSSFRSHDLVFIMSLVYYMNIYWKICGQICSCNASCIIHLLCYIKISRFAIAYVKVNIWFFPCPMPLRLGNTGI